MRGFRTDLAMESVGEESGRLEGVSMSAHQIGGVKRTRIVIQSRRAAEVLQRPVGEYITLECPELSRCGQPERQMLIRLIAQAVRALLPKEGEVLVVGLGNRNVTADALGTRVVERTLVTRHLGESLAREMRGRLRGVSAIAPGVLGLTGIETAELCRGLIQRVRPAAVVAIDALAAFDSGRICSTIQITNTGIEPGSGVGNHRLGLTEETLGVRVICRGRAHGGVRLHHCPGCHGPADGGISRGFRRPFRSRRAAAAAGGGRLSGQYGGHAPGDRRNGAQRGRSAQ